MPKDDKITAAQNEAAGATTADVEWNGRTWTVPASFDDWDFDAVHALELGRGASTLLAVLGPAQARTFRSGDRRSGRDAGELLGLIVDAVTGGSTGE